MARVLKQAENGFSGLDILLDETICHGQIFIEKNLLIDVGGINSYLRTKQKYELIVRIAFQSPVIFIDETPQNLNEYILLDDNSTQDNEKHGWKTDCYVTGLYSKQLQELGLFDTIINTIINEANNLNRTNETISFLEQMISKKEPYWQIAEGSCPILIYKGENICYNILNIFAEQFGNALSNFGKKVIYFDAEQNDVQVLTKYMYQHFQAIIGFQTFLFSITIKNKKHYLHEYIYGPKFNFIFDHPIWIMKHLQQHYNNFFILTHDINYITFIEHYFNQKANFFPPGGILYNTKQKFKRIYDLTFIGTYTNYRNEILNIHRMERNKRFIANQFLLTMRKNPNYTPEHALQLVLKQRNILISDSDFIDLLYELRLVINCVMHYYREKVILKILENGIQVDVFSDSWNNSPLSNYTNLICHSNVNLEESLKIWQQSKISLNIMSWHKGGFTERMSNIMLQGAVLLTDNTTYLIDKYNDNELVSFNLDDLENLPNKIHRLLNDNETRSQIAENGKNKTLQYHTWSKRAEQFLALLNNQLNL